MTKRNLRMRRILTILKKGMNCVCLTIFLFVVPVLSLNSRNLRPFHPSNHYNHVSMNRYSNTWALKISGGVERADEIARKHGLTNRGQIGQLKDVYLFELESQPRQMKEMPEITAALNNEEMVYYVEQQKFSRHVPKTE